MLIEIEFEKHLGLTPIPFDKQSSGTSTSD